MHPLPLSNPQGRGCQATDKRHAYSDTLVRQAVDAAVAEGFPLQGKPEGERLLGLPVPLLPLLLCAAAAASAPAVAAAGLLGLLTPRPPPFSPPAPPPMTAPARMENVWAAMHSAAACFYPASPMKHCAGAVMLAAVVDGMICSVRPRPAFAPMPLHAAR